MENITSGNSSPEEFIAYLNSQDNIGSLDELNWVQRPIWKVFLSTNPKDAEMHGFLLAYKALGGDLFELDRYTQNVLNFRLERARNSYALTLEVLLQTLELAGDLSQYENLGTALWEYCLRNDWDESQKIAALTRYHELGGDCSVRGNYGHIFKEIAELPSIELWNLVASWTDLVLDDEFVVGGEGAQRIEFCEFLLENGVPLSNWGELTFTHALRDSDLGLLDKLLEWGWELNLNDSNIYDRANSIETYRKLIHLGVSLNPTSSYPGDSPVYSAVYNLSYKLKDYREYPDDLYLEWVDESKEVLVLLLQSGGRLDLPFEYTSDYPPLTAMFAEYPEIFDLVKEHGDAEGVAFWEQKMRG